MGRMILTLRLPPAALDLLRLAVLHPSLPDAFANEPYKLVDAIVEAGQLSSDQDGAANVAINCMMCVRALSNLCCTNAGRRVLLATLNKVGSRTAGSAGRTFNSSVVCCGNRVWAHAQVVQALSSMSSDTGTEPYHLAVATLCLKYT